MVVLIRTIMGFAVWLSLLCVAVICLADDRNVVEYNFEVSEVIAAPDGFERPMLQVNGQYPGPLIRVKRVR